jgi:hypothetical protein
MSKTKTESAEIEALLIELLRSDLEPQHYRTLTEVIGSVYELDKIYSRPSDSIYGILTKLARHPNGGVKFMGKGIFIAEEAVVDVINSDNEEAKKLIVEPSKPKAPTPKKVRRVELSMVCGDCEYASRSHIQMFASRLVTCGCTSSGRDFPDRDEAGCEMYRPKTMQQQEREHIERINMAVLVEAINIGVSKHRGRKLDGAM